MAVIAAARLRFVAVPAAARLRFVAVIGRGVSGSLKQASPLCVAPVREIPGVPKPLAFFFRLGPRFVREAPPGSGRPTREIQGLRNNSSFVKLGPQPVYASIQHYLMVPQAVAAARTETSTFEATRAEEADRESVKRNAAQWMLDRGDEMVESPVGEASASPTACAVVSPGSLQNHLDESELSGILVSDGTD